jgi:HEPN domain-containing protein
VKRQSARAAAQSDDPRARAVGFLMALYQRRLASSVMAIKAVMIQRNVEFPYVHDLGRLLSLLEEAGEPIPEVVRKAEELTRYALVTRYRGIAGAVSEQEHAEAVEIAESVVQWAEERL